MVPQALLPINTSVVSKVFVLILPLLKAVNVVFVKLEVLPSEFYILSFIMNCEIKELVSGQENSPLCTQNDR